METTKSTNGRVNLFRKNETPAISKLFAMYDRIPAKQCSSLREATIGQWDDTILSTAYFSKDNIQIIQNSIRAGVYFKSNQQYVVSVQDCDSLKIVMRSVFLQHSVNQTNNITEQIIELNKMVTDYCIIQVYSEAQGYMKYLYDVSTLAVPLSTPVTDSQFDKKNIRMPSWF